MEFTGERTTPSADRAVAGHASHHVHLISCLVGDNVQIAADAVEIGIGTWAIHGVIPVDGSVIVAEFGSYVEARLVLDTIRGGPVSAAHESSALLALDGHRLETVHDDVGR